MLSITSDEPKPRGVEDRVLAHLSEKVKDLVDGTEVSSSALEALSVALEFPENGASVTYRVLEQDFVGGVSLINRQNVTELHEQEYVELKQVASTLAECHINAGNILRYINQTVSEVQACRGANDKVLHKAQALQQARWKLQWRRRMAAAFIRLLTVSDDTTRVLLLPTTNAEQLTVQLFDAIQELDTIKRNALALASLIDNATRNVQQSNASDQLLATTAAALHLNKQASVDALRETEELADLANEKLFLLLQLTFHRVEDPAILLLPSEYKYDLEPFFTPKAFAETCNYVQKAVEYCRLTPRLFQMLVTELVKKRRQLLLQTLTMPPAIDNAHHAVHDQCNIKTDSASNDNLWDQFLPSLLTSRLDASRVSAELIQAFCSAAVKEQEFALALLRPVSVSGGSEMSEPKNDVSEKKQSFTAVSSSAAPAVSDFCNSETATNSLLTTAPVFVSPSSIVDYVLSGSSKLLRSKLQKVLEDEASSALAPNVLTHFPRLILSSGSLEELRELCCSSFLKDCIQLHQIAQESFLSVWQSQMFLFDLLQQMSRIALLPPDDLWTPDLLPPAILRDYAASLSEALRLCELLQRQCGQPQDSTEGAEGFLDHIVQSAVAPLLNFIRQAAHLLIDPLSQAVYLLNCYECIQASLGRCTVAQRYAQLCNELIEDQLHRFIVEESNYVLEKFGFLERIEALRQWSARSPDVKERQPISTVAVLHPLSLSACFRSFYNTLFSSDEFKLPRANAIASRPLRMKARKKVLAAIVGAYEELYVGTGFTGAATYSPEQVRQLLDL